MPRRCVEFFLIDMLIALDAVRRKTEDMKDCLDLLRDEDAWLAVTRSLEIVGEAMKSVLESKEIDPQKIKASWRHVVDFRNVIAHEYFGLNVEQVFHIVKTSAPKLESELLDLLKSLPDKKMLLWALEEAIIELEEAHRRASIEYLENLQKELA